MQIQDSTTNMDFSKVESGVQLFSRINAQSTSDNLQLQLFPSGLYPNSCVEIVGGQGTGKTLLLMDYIVDCIIPKKCNEIDLPGNGTSVIFVNNDHQFNLFNIVNLITYKLKKFSDKSINNLVEDCLRNLTILNCFSSSQFKFTVLNMEKILQSNKNIAVIAIDSLSAYYWIDRLDMGFVSFNSYCSVILNDLKNVIKGFNVNVLFTKVDANDACPTAGDSDYNVKLKQLLDGFYEAVVSDKTHVVSSTRYRINQFIHFV